MTQAPSRPIVLVTGSEGLIGAPLCRALAAAGWQVRRLDLRARGVAAGDIRDTRRLAGLLAGVAGVVHLAALSRVVEAERDPEACVAINLHATVDLARQARAAGAGWMLFASSREVYGAQPEGLVAEDAALAPLNVYGRSKAEAESAVQRLSDPGFHGAVVRFSSVFGGVNDHATRVVPLFLAQARAGATLRVEGRGHCFDFTFVDAVVAGLLGLIDRLQAGVRLPPLHLVSGRGVTLWDLAEAAVAAVPRSQARIALAPPRRYDMDRFVGDPARAWTLIGWRHDPMLIKAGLGRLLARQLASEAASRASAAPD